MLQPYLPWTSSLTFLIIRDIHSFTSFTNNDAALVLSAFPLLVHCALHITLADIDDLMDHGEVAAQVDMMNVTTGLVRLNHLKSIALSWSAFADIGPLLDALATPSLTELELSGALPFAGDNERWSHLSNFLHRSAAPLTFLTLEHTDCLYLALIECLEACPNLKGLWLDDCIVDDDLIRGLYRPPLTMNSLPGAAIGLGKGVLTTLNTLVLRSCYLFSLDVLISVLRAREEHLGPDPTTPTQLSVRGQQLQASQGSNSNTSENLMTYVVDCGDVTPVQARMIENLGMGGLIIGPRMSG